MDRFCSTAARLGAFFRSIAAAFRKASIALSQSWFRLAWAPSLANLVASGLPCPRANCDSEIATVTIRQRAVKIFMICDFDDEPELTIRTTIAEYLIQRPLVTSLLKRALVR